MEDYFTREECQFARKCKTKQEAIIALCGVDVVKIKANNRRFYHKLDRSLKLYHMTWYRYRWTMAEEQQIAKSYTTPNDVWLQAVKDANLNQQYIRGTARNIR